MHRTARERLDLIDNEGEERRDHNRQAGRDERGKVEAAALAGSSGHHHEHIATAHRRVDRPQLERPQRAVAKDGAIRERELGRPRKAVAVKSGGRHVVLVVHRVVRVRRARFRIGSGQQQLWLWWWWFSGRREEQRRGGWRGGDRHDFIRPRRRRDFILSKRRRADERLRGQGVQRTATSGWAGRRQRPRVGPWWRVFGDDDASRLVA